MTMLYRSAITFALTLTLLLPSASLGQEQHAHPVPKQLGTVSFPVSCAPGVQTKFNEGVAMIHSFAYADAERTFREIAQADPKCAMAHWGIAMSYYHQLWDPPISPADLPLGHTEIEKAQGLKRTSPREKQFIGALALVYRNPEKVPYASRALAYEKAMEALATGNPNEPESQIFFALALLATASPADRTHTNQKRAAKILEPLFARYPRHPGVAHYLIHAYDSPELAKEGLPAARAYAQVAPSAAHALHMPSHIFTQLGLWDDSIRSNLAARAAAHQNGDIGEELHAMDYLMYAYLQEARYAEASQLLEELRAMRTLPYDQFKVGYAAAAMPARYAAERHAWREEAETRANAGSAPQVLAITYWSRAVGKARDGKPAEARPALETLNKLLAEIRKNNDAYWSAQVEIQIREAMGWIARADLKDSDAVSFLKAAANAEDGLEKRPVTPGPIIPAREQLGELLLELDRSGDALAEFEQVLKNAPGRRGALVGAAEAARESGNPAKAGEFERILAAQSSGKSN